MSRIFGFVLGGLSLIASPSFAHIQLDYPPARTTSQKSSPCGAAGSVRGESITRLQAGETLIVRWRETINHPGHYRISFDDDGQDFVEPASFTDFYTDGSVLHDDIADKSGGEYTFEMTVPNVSCTNCTLQVVQVMTDKAPYGDGNDLYYQCADIEIVQDSADMGTDDMGVLDMGEPDVGLDMDSPDLPVPVDPIVDMGSEDEHEHNHEEPPAPIEGEGSACSSVGGGVSLLPIALLFGFRRRRILRSQHAR